MYIRRRTIGVIGFIAVMATACSDGASTGPGTSAAQLPSWQLEPPLSPVLGPVLSGRAALEVVLKDTRGRTPKRPWRPADRRDPLATQASDGAEIEAAPRIRDATTAATTCISYGCEAGRVAAYVAYADAVLGRNEIEIAVAAGDYSFDMPTIDDQGHGSECAPADIVACTNGRWDTAVPVTMPGCSAALTAGTSHTAMNALFLVDERVPGAEAAWASSGDDSTTPPCPEPLPPEEEGEGEEECDHEECEPYEGDCYICQQWFYIYRDRIVEAWECWETSPEVCEGEVW